MDLLGRMDASIGLLICEYIYSLIMSKGKILELWLIIDMRMDMLREYIYSLNTSKGKILE